MKILHVTTEGDCEGRSTRSLGYFTGTVEQVISHCVSNNIKPCYQYKVSSIEVTQTSEEVESISFDIDKYGYIRNLKTKEQITAEQKEDQAKEEALSKLTNEEKRLLGLE